MEIGEKIKQLRLEKKLSQKDLALKLSTTQPNIAYFESRGNTITIEQCIKIATALEVSIKSLLFDDIDYTDVPNSKEVENLLIAKDKEIENLRNEIERLKKELKGSERTITLMQQIAELSEELISSQKETLKDYKKSVIKDIRDGKKEIIVLEKELEDAQRKENIVFAYALTIAPLKLVDRVKNAISKEVDFDVFIKIFKNYPEIEDKINKEFDRLFGVDE